MGRLDLSEHRVRLEHLVSLALVALLGPWEQPEAMVHKELLG